MSEPSGWSGREIIAVLQKMGFVWVRTNGSHAVLRSGSSQCIVPIHGEVAVGTLRSALRQAEISPAEFLRNA
ncbi:MAG: type II toxin-antitoxin system HicA family toxin [Synergistaceae bacterium]|nr:type II toxin-antitoxin system HicA family toxin [Synergistaceae bacterium]